MYGYRHLVHRERGKFIQVIRTFPSQPPLMHGNKRPKFATVIGGNDPGMCVYVYVWPDGPVNGEYWYFIWDRAVHTTSYKAGVKVVSPAAQTVCFPSDIRGWVCASSFLPSVHRTPGHHGCVIMLVAILYSALLMYIDGRFNTLLRTTIVDSICRTILLLYCGEIEIGLGVVAKVKVYKIMIVF